MEISGIFKQKLILNKGVKIIYYYWHYEFNSNLVISHISTVSKMKSTLSSIMFL